MGLYDKKKVYERVRTHIYKSLKYESEHGTDIDLPEQSIDSATPEILQSFENTYLEESAIQIKQKDLNVLENLIKEVEDMKEQVMNLRALLSVQKYEEKNPDIFSTGTALERSDVGSTCSASDLANDDEKKLRVSETTALDVDEYEQPSKARNRIRLVQFRNDPDSMQRV